MNRKTITALFLVIVMLFSSLTIIHGEEKRFNPGSYSGEAQGFGGVVTVNVDLSDNEIVNITAVGENETPGIGSIAIETLPAKILEKQSTGVDAVAGCTITSKAIIEALENALVEAGANLDKIRIVSEDSAKEKEVKELSTEILILGGGGSGLTAALAADEAGSKVLLLEKMPYLGGAAAISGGQVNACGSKFQAEKGYEDSADAFFLDLMKGGHYKNDARLVRVYAEHVGETFDWMVDKLGIKFAENPAILPEHRVPRVWMAENGAAGYTATILENLEASGVEVMLNTKATELISEDGAIVGAFAEDENNIYKISAKAVIMATGGFGNNKELLPPLLSESLYYGPVSATGDGHLMMQALDIPLYYMQYGKVYPNGIEVSPGFAKSTWHGSIATCRDASTLIVDRSGNRVVNENGLAENIRAKLYEQPDKTLFLVMDQSTFDMFRDLIVNAGKSATQEQVDEWLNNNGSTTPVFAHGDTLKAAAEAAGIDGDALEQTVAKFNEMVAAGVDTEFGREPLMAVGEGPYYLVEQKPRFATTLGGVRISTNMEVLDKNDQVIPGLFAAGEIVGGVHGDDTIVSTAVGWAFTSGHLVGIITSDYVKK
ncbi:MAG: FAD-dependent oxidoreductase [Christensenellaceae bacterium]|nr:FAD-dependent oxidoreductase [Christensenellaceae bacterium]